MLAHITAVAMKRSWPQRPKLHYAVAHLGKQASMVNPRFVQAYASESMVGRVTGIYKKSMNGPFHKGVQKKVSLKYCTGLLLEWTPGACIGFV